MQATVCYINLFILLYDAMFCLKPFTIKRYQAKIEHFLSIYFLPILVCTALSTAYLGNYYYWLSVSLSAFMLLSARKRSVLLLSICIGSSALFALYFQHSFAKQEACLKHFISATHNTVTGVVTSGAKAGFLKLTVNESLELNVKLKDTVSDSQFKPGDKVRVSGKYLEPKKSRNPGAFNAYRYAIIHQSAGLFIANSITKIAEIDGYRLQQWAYQIKASILEQHKAHMSSDYANLYSALVFGEMLTSLSKELKDSFIKSGLLHALVVSGSQVSLLLSCLHRVLNACSIYRYYQFIVLVPAGGFFYLITGGGASILRALLMTAILLCMKSLLQYRSTNSHCLSLTALIMMLINPLIILNLGAILSFVVTASLLFAVKPVESKLPKRLPKHIKQSLCLGLVPWLWSFPILALSLHLVSLVAIVVNALLAFIIEYTVIIGFFSTCIGFLVPPLAFMLDQLALLLLKSIVSIAIWSANLDLSVIYIAKLPMHYQIITLVLLILCFGSFTLKRFRAYSLIALLLFFSTVQIAAQLKQELIITFLDVGQGDSALIEYKNQHILVDTGNRFSPQFGNICKTVLLPALRSKAIHHLDAVIITHFDSDHMGALEELAAHIPITTLIHNGNLNKHPNLNALVKRHSIHAVAIKGDETLQTGKLAFQFFQTSALNKQNKNNQSLVFKLSLNHHQILFTGDIEKEAESSLATKYGTVLRSTLLKIPHHGSKTSSSEFFLSVVNPRVSIISAGIRNRYGHPHPKITRKLRQISRVYRSDKHGAIEFTLGNKSSVKTYANKQKSRLII